MKQKLTTLALIPTVVITTNIASSLPASAERVDSVCDMRGVPQNSAMETFKSAFIEADAKTIQSTFAGSIAIDTIETALSQYKGIAPSGAEGCTIALQRTDLGGMVQEISIFHPKGNGQTIFLYLITVPRQEGGEGIYFFNFSTDIKDTLALLR